MKNPCLKCKKKADCFNVDVCPEMISYEDTKLKEGVCPKCGSDIIKSTKRIPPCNIVDKQKCSKCKFDLETWSREDK